MLSHTVGYDGGDTGFSSLMATWHSGIADPDGDLIRLVGA